MKKSVIEFLLAPLVPIFLLVFFIVINIFELKLIYLVLIGLVLFLAYKIINKLKENWKCLYSSSIICADWFLLDVINLFSNENLSFLKPSILETVIRTTLVI